MSGFPLVAPRPETIFLSSLGAVSGPGDTLIATKFGSASAAAWPAANRAYYVSIYVQRSVTVYQMAVYNGTHSGNVDVGIYDEGKNALVRAGSTASSGDSQPQTFNVADTSLVAGTYFFAMWADNATITIQRAALQQQLLMASGQQQQSSLTTGLPSAATFAALATGYLPVIVAACYASPAI